MFEFRKWMFGMALLILGFGIGRHLNSWKSSPVSSSAEESVSFKTDKSATDGDASEPPSTTKISKQKESPASQASTPPSPEFMLELAKGEKLYSFLFDTKSLKSLSWNSLVKILERRFHSPYPDPVSKHGDPRHQEIVARLGVLKAIAVQYDWRRLNADEKKSFVRFHKSIASDAHEDLMVQTQAARNLRLWMSSLDHNDRMMEQKDISPQVLALATKSDRQLAQEVVTHEK